MKHIAPILILVFMAGLFSARAQSADDQYIGIYDEIQQADALANSGDSQPAIVKYVDAQSQLQQFQRVFPDWNPKLVTVRLKYLADKISDLTPAQSPLPPPIIATNSPDIFASGNDAELAALRVQLQSSQIENTTLLAKLKEALTPQPAVTQDELVPTQEQIRLLRKENDLLKAVVAENHATANHPATFGTNSLAEINQLEAEVKNLRARLAVDEASPVPFTAEELAALKQLPPQPVADVAPPKKTFRTPPADAAKLLTEAQNYFSAGQFSSAETVYLKLLQEGGSSPVVLGDLATIEMQEDKLDAAEKHLQAALEENPDDSHNLATLGYLKFRRGKYDEAIDVFSRAAKLDPQNPEILNYLAETLCEKGLRSQAEAALRKAIELNPNYAIAHCNLALIYVSQTPPMIELARWHYQKALDAGQPHNPELEKLLAEKSASPAK
jgi:tetratricopeptide (TPR) repeat protein